MFSRGYIMTRVTKFLLLNPLIGPSISSTAFNFCRSISSSKYQDVTIFTSSAKPEKLTDTLTPAVSTKKPKKSKLPKLTNVVETVGVSEHVAVIKKAKKKILTRAQMRYMENKAIFGALLETKAEKDRQIKKEIKLAKKSAESTKKTKVSLDLIHDESIKLVEEAPAPKVLPDKSIESAPKVLPDKSSGMTNENKNPISIVKASSFIPFSTTKKLRVKGGDKPLTSTPEDKISKESNKNPFAKNTENSYHTGEIELENGINVVNQSATEHVLDIAQSFDLAQPISIPLPAKQGIRLPSVTKILSATMPPEQKEILEKWEKKMIAEMGLEGFQNFKKDMLSNGRELHLNIHDLLIGIPEDHLTIRNANEGHWRSMKNIFKEITQVRVLESHVTHPKLDYCGIVDCVAHYRDDLVLIDWKTSKKPKPVVSMTYDTPLQIAAYIGAINEDPSYKSMKINRGLIVIAYESGQMCETFMLTPSDIDTYWNRWKERLDLFKQQAISNTTS